MTSAESGSLYLCARLVSRFHCGGTPALTGHQRPAETAPEEAGDVFARVQPKLAVFSHIVLPEATVQDLIPPARKHYAGPLELGEDLDVIEVGDTVTLHRARP
jgi:ribonuclease Z